MSRRLPFTKMHGAGNDFVVFDALRDTLPEDMEALCRQVSHRHFGVGADQVLVVRASGEADFRMDIYNADGGQVEMCGNGLRAFHKYLRDHGHTDADEIRVETLAGIVVPRWMGDDMVRVDMGRPILQPAKIPTTLGEGDGPVLDVALELEHRGATERVVLSSASMGNPHAVIVVDDVDAAPVHSLGAAVENSAAFPNRTNVEFVSIVDRSHIRQRTWERGVGETLACGSGACAVGVVSMLRGVVDANVAVELRGGTLQIEWAGEGESVYMTGPAAEVFTGTFRFEED